MKKSYFKYPVYALLSIWNPFKRTWKPRWADGSPVLDILSRRLSKKISEAETKRRIENGEDLIQCFKRGSRRVLKLSGKSM